MEPITPPPHEHRKVIKPIKKLNMKNKMDYPTVLNKAITNPKDLTREERNFIAEHRATPQQVAERIQEINTPIPLPPPTAGQLIDALISGKSLVKNHKVLDGIEPEYLHCEISNNTQYLRSGGWGSTFIQPKDRILDIMQHPEDWKVKP